MILVLRVSARIAKKTQSPQMITAIFGKSKDACVNRIIIMILVFRVSARIAKKTQSPQMITKILSKRTDASVTTIFIILIKRASSVPMARLRVKGRT